MTFPLPHPFQRKMFSHECAICSMLLMHSNHTPARSEPRRAEEKLHKRKDGLECDYLAALVCNKCGWVDSAPAPSPEMLPVPGEYSPAYQYWRSGGQSAHSPEPHDPKTCRALTPPCVSCAPEPQGKTLTVYECLRCGMRRIAKPHPHGCCDCGAEMVEVVYVRKEKP